MIEDVSRKKKKKPRMFLHVHFFHSTLRLEHNVDVYEFVRETF